MLKKSSTDALRTASIRAIQKTAQAKGDLTDNKITDKITSVPKRSSKELHSMELHSKESLANETNNKVPKERYISPQERQQIIDELRLI